MDVHIHKAIARPGVSESAAARTIRRRRRRRRARHHGRLRTAVTWYLTGIRLRNALILLAIMALAAAGGGVVAMFTYAAWP